LKEHLEEVICAWRGSLKSSLQHFLHKFLGSLAGLEHLGCKYLVEVGSRTFTIFTSEHGHWDQAATKLGKDIKTITEELPIMGRIAASDTSLDGLRL